MSQLIECPTCKKQVSGAAASCPHCGEPLTVPQKKSKLRWLFSTIGVLFIVLGFAVIAKGCQMMSITDGTSISRSYTTPAAVLLCVGLFCAIAPFCRSK